MTNSLEEETATHSSTLAWKIPWTEEPDRLQSMGSQRVGHDWATNSWVGKIPWRRKWRPTPVFLPGESPWTEEPDRLQSMGSQSVMCLSVQVHAHWLMQSITFLYAYWPSWYAFFWSILFKSLAYFSIGCLLCPPYDYFRRSLCILSMRYSLNIWIANIFSDWILPFYS